jgi:hypothetical protein
MKMTGRATSFATFEERGQLRAIETYLGHPVPLAEGSPRPNDRPHSRILERPRGSHQGWGAQGRSHASISHGPRRTKGPSVT